MSATKSLSSCVKHVPTSFRSIWQSCCRFQRDFQTTASAFHRAFCEIDVESCRRVKTGKHVGISSNPGIRVEAKFLPEKEVKPLVDELEILKAKYGFTTAGHGLSLLRKDTLNEDSATEMSGDATGKFQSLRVTGRPEGQEATAPWGYGNDFDCSFVTPRLSSFIDLVRGCGHFELGTCVCMNFTPFSPSCLLYCHLCLQCTDIKPSSYRYLLTLFPSTWILLRASRTSRKYASVIRHMHVLGVKSALLVLFW